jgi:cation transporter-like permease
MSANRWLPPDPDAPPSVAPTSVAPPGFVASTKPSGGRDPQGRPQRYAAATTGDWVGGVLLSLLVPVVAAIVGVVYVAKGGEKQRVGVMCIVLSCLVFLGWFVVFSLSNAATH